MPKSPPALAAALVVLFVPALATPAVAQTTEALTIAVMQNDPAAIDRAIRAGADPRALGPNGSPLAIAAMSGRARAVRALLDHGADPAAPGPNGGNALTSAFFAMNGVALLGRDEAPDPARRAVVVDEYLSTTDAFGHAELARAVARPHAGHQAEAGGVGQFDGVVLVLEGHGAKHRAEDLFLRQAVLHRHVAQQRGRLVEAGLGGLVHDLALGHHGDAVHLRVGEEIPHPLLLAGADQRAKVQVHGGRPHAQAFECFAQAIEQGFVDQRVDQHARTGRARQASSEGLTTHTLPAARAPPTLRPKIRIG